ncbi:MULTISPECIES: glycosyltransferase [Gammaproteobacteria]|uniref:glycosyltransferase n=1 Tax=Gammaproteobacteria TaxID=1236 RepID=UPI000DD04959|nr:MULTISPECIES: glycosyltransferase [Gammaproteobacteria]RTE86836.1 glycosyltransferase [Aliidiomarina sp. B3213]TCZ93375.1 glycosyltransferase [Lysobacter sp. N42]
METNPHVTLIMFSFNQEEFIEESVRSAFAQDYSNLQIIISDDTSSDETFAIIERLAEDYKGSHQIKINRNEHNLGVGRHFAFIMEELADGELIVACGGDDISHSNRVSRIVEEWLEHGKPALVAHALEEINEQGEVFEGGRTIQYRYQDHSLLSNPTLALQDYLKNQMPVRYLGAAIAYRRDTYLRFGTPLAFPDFEDHVMFFRALLSEGAHYFPEVLVQYRRHQNSFMAAPSKRKIVKPGEIFAPLLHKGETVRPNFVNDYRLHQLATQQWLDLRAAIQQGLTAVDYQIVEELWAMLIARQKFLLGNQGITLKSLFRRFRNFILGTSNTNVRKRIELNYVEPLKVVLYGAGQAGRNALSRLSPGFQVEAICDSNSELHGTRVEGIQVISPQTLKELSEDIDSVLISSVFYYEIKSALMDKLGISEDKIVRLPHKVITLRK